MKFIQQYIRIPVLQDIVSGLPTRRRFSGGSTPLTRAKMSFDEWLLQPGDSIPAKIDDGNVTSPRDFGSTVEEKKYLSLSHELESNVPAGSHRAARQAGIVFFTLPLEGLRGTSGEGKSMVVALPRDEIRIAALPIAIAMTLPMGG